MSDAPFVPAAPPPRPANLTPTAPVPAPPPPASGTVLFVGKTLPLPIKVYDQNKALIDIIPGSVAWISSDPAVAKIDIVSDGSGNAVGVSEGKAEISASVTGVRAISTPPVTIAVVKQIPTTAEIVLPAPTKVV